MNRDLKYKRKTKKDVKIVTNVTLLYHTLTIQTQLSNKSVKKVFTRKNRL